MSDERVSRFTFPHLCHSEHGKVLVLNVGLRLSKQYDSLCYRETRITEGNSYFDDELLDVLSLRIQEQRSLSVLQMVELSFHPARARNEVHELNVDPEGLDRGLPRVVAGV